MSAKAILFGMLKKVDGSKNGIGLTMGEMTLDSGSIKELFMISKDEKRIRVSIEPFQEEMFDDPSEAANEDEDLFDEDAA